MSAPARGRRIAEPALAAILLAAGRGVRMGMPKARVVVDGKTLAEHHVARLRELGCSPIVVVVRPEVAELGQLGASVVLVAARTVDQAGSLVAGTRALAASSADEARMPVVVSPVDMMPASLAALEGLRAAMTPELDAVTPTHGGRGGHPALVRRHVLDALSAGAREGARLPSLRDVLGRLGPRRARVEVSDPAVLGDFDVPADLGRAARHGRLAQREG